MGGQSKFTKLNRSVVRNGIFFTLYDSTLPSTAILSHYTLSTITQAALGTPCASVPSSTYIYFVSPPSLARRLSYHPLRSDSISAVKIWYRSPPLISYHVTFYVSSTFATSNLLLLRSKHFRESFSHRYARLSIRTYVAVFLNKRLRVC